MNKIEALIRKEWSEVFRNRVVVFAVAFLPLVLTAIPLALLFAVRDSQDGANFSLGEFSAAFAETCGDLTIAECNQFILITQFLPLFLMMPAIIPVTIAAYSIVGEKTTRTLEPLLATPIRTTELLIGKGLAAALPGIAATWAAFLLFVIGALLIGLQRKVVEMFFDPLWLAAIFVVGPLLAMASVSLAVMVSSRTNDPRVAEQIASLVVLPVAALLISQVTGVLLLNAVVIGWIALVLAVLDVGLLYIAGQLFQRETILTRWK